MFNKVMKYDAFNTTQKQNPREYIGKQRIQLGRKKARISRSQFKTNVVCLFYQKEIVYHKGEAVIENLYLEAAKWLRESLQRKGHELWRNKWILRYSNAPAHDTLDFCDFLANKFIAKIKHPPYSLDLTLCNFRLFRKLKITVKGQKFTDTLNIWQHKIALMKCIPENEFQECFQQWH